MNVRKQSSSANPANPYEEIARRLTSIAQELGTLAAARSGSVAISRVLLRFADAWEALDVGKTTFYQMLRADVRLRRCVVNLPAHHPRRTAHQRRGARGLYR
jgi:hypothetical protein